MLDNDRVEKERFESLQMQGKVNTPVLQEKSFLDWAPEDTAKGLESVTNVSKSQSAGFCLSSSMQV